ncbi:MAG: hypothetical protein ABI317_10550 [Gaiellales bacterium]
MDSQMARRAAPFVYAIAVLIAVFFASGRVVAAVAAIGGVALGLFYTMTRGTSTR